MANDTTTKVTDLNEAEQVAENDVFLLTHSNGLSEKVTAETLFKNGSKTIVLTRAEYDALGGDYKQDAIYAISDESTGGINVDQTYDPEGVNPLSGQAVNGALTNYQLFPDYARMYTIDLDSNNSYTATEDGFFNLEVGSNYNGTGQRDFYINNKMVANAIRLNNNTFNLFFPVKKGDVLMSSAGKVGDYTFIPIRH